MARCVLTQTHPFSLILSRFLLFDVKELLAIRIVVCEIKIHPTSLTTEHTDPGGGRIGSESYLFSHEVDCSRPWRPDYATLAFTRRASGGREWQICYASVPAGWDWNNGMAGGCKPIGECSKEIRQARPMP